ncbi:small ribosomal subunit protein mS29-like [Convolutriloba macropyga]|uniref:small ribosomal subunit protein mS29-like n=1 Tax=Convolutriloba macropyga TaxID=536237 RepID=UPI003F520DD2
MKHLIRIVNYRVSFVPRLLNQHRASCFGLMRCARRLSSESAETKAVPDEFEALFASNLERNVDETKDSSTISASYDRKSYNVEQPVYQSSSDLPSDCFARDYSIEKHFEFELQNILHKFYTVPEENFVDMFHKGQLMPAFKAIDAKTFNKMCLMIRKPSLEAIHYISQADLQKPPLKILFYGKIGSGKSSCLLHLQHFLCSQNYLVIPIVHLRSTFHAWQEVLFEADEDGNVPVNAKAQQPVKAAEWISKLLGIKASRDYLSQLTTDKEYVWGVDEVSEEGSTLLSLCKFALERPRRASVIASVLMEEIKRYANLGTVKVAVVLDEAERLFKGTEIMDPRAYSGPTNKRDTVRVGSRKLQADELELACAFKKLLNPDWKNSIVVGSVRAPELYPEQVTPRAILGVDAFNRLMPFVPIEVPLYNKTEFLNQLAFFRDQKWLQTENIQMKEQIDQLAFLSNRHPTRLYEICSLL